MRRAAKGKLCCVFTDEGFDSPSPCSRRSNRDGEGVPAKSCAVCSPMKVFTRPNQLGWSIKSSNAGPASYICCKFT